MSMREIRTASHLEREDSGEVRLTELFELPLESEATLDNVWKVWWWYWPKKGLPCYYGCIPWHLKI
jgi:hypothetical protein